MQREIQQSRYRNRHEIYTDGSVKDEEAGCGIYSEEFQLCAHLPKGTSVFTSELTAIYYAIKYIQNKEGNYIIYSDSFSALSVLRNVSKTNNYVAHKIYQEMIKLPPNKLLFEWIPSHVGIHGNEKADKLAQKGTKVARVNNSPLPIQELKAKINQFIYKKWQQYWQASLSVNLAIKPNLGPPIGIGMPRRDQVMITRLRLGACRFTHDHLFSKSE